MGDTILAIRQEDTCERKLTKPPKSPTTSTANLSNVHEDDSARGKNISACGANLVTVDRLSDNDDDASTKLTSNTDVTIEVTTTETSTETDKTIAPTVNKSMETTVISDNPQNIIDSPSIDATVDTVDILSKAAVETSME